MRWNYCEDKRTVPNRNEEMRKRKRLRNVVAIFIIAMLIVVKYQTPVKIETGSGNTGSQSTSEDINKKEETEMRVFTSEEISDDIFNRINGISYGADCTIPREDLRYLQVSYVGFDGESHVGEIICNKAISEDLLDIFEQLYDAKYEIERIELVDNYNGDDEASMEANNSSCFNFRFIAGTTTISNHAKGMAIDINPLYNPYITSSGFTPVNAGDYVDRSTAFAHKIDENDLCYQLFIEHGFTWGGSWTHSKDYQHFEKE